MTCRLLGQADFRKSSALNRTGICRIRDALLSCAHDERSRAVLAIVAAMVGTTLAARVLEAMTDKQFRS